METRSLTQHFGEDALGLQLVAEEVAAGERGDGGDFRDPLVAAVWIEGSSQESLEGFASFRGEADDFARAAFGADEAGAAAVEEQRSRRDPGEARRRRIPKERGRDPRA
jgi:hypothetical protein